MNDDRGFTLLEVLVVLTIIGITTSVTVLSVPTLLSRGQFRELATRLDDFLDRVRSDAIAGGTPVAVHFDEENHRLLSSGSNRALRLPANAKISFQGIGARDSNGATPDTLVFLPDGSSSGGKIVLQMGAIVTQRQISWLTGTASVAR